MGMAASQARLISITARMNDVEYQGQQINQQRTTLSNQVNALYNQLLEISVPTPPSPNDFVKIEYSGKDKVSSFTIKSIYPTGDNKYTLNLNYSQAGNIVEKSTDGVRVAHQPDTINVSEVSGNDLERFKALMTKSANVQNKDGEVYKYNGSDSDQDLLIKVDNVNYIPSGIKPEDIYFYTKNADGEEVLVSEADFDIPDGYIKGYYVKCNMADLNPEDPNYSTYKDLLTPNAEESWTNVYKTSEKKNVQFADNNIGDNAKIAIVGKNFYIQDGTGIKKIDMNFINSANAIQNILTGTIFQYDPSGNPMKNNDKGDSEYVVKGYTSKEEEYSYSAYSLKSSIVPQLIMSEDEYKKLVESLQHKFEISEEEVKDRFLVYWDKIANEPKCIDMQDLSAIVVSGEKTGVPVWAQTTGTYSETKEYENCGLEFDNNGRIVRVTITDELGNEHTISVTPEETKDEAAYAEANKQYEYEKYLYDKKQQEINARTSIIQREDKNLELKLTRLDNERNALKTEMDAVKEVLKNCIERGFKTFSG